MKKIGLKRGFTLSELLIVVAIIAVLVAIAIPVFSSQLHKSRVAVDWANTRAYFAELQLDFLQTGKVDESKLREMNLSMTNGLKSITLDGQTIQLKEGSLWIAPEDNEHPKGYNFYYMCNKGDCTLTLPQD